MIIAAALNEAKEELSRSKSNALPGGQLLKGAHGPFMFIAPSWRHDNACNGCVAQHSVL